MDLCSFEFVKMAEVDSDEDLTKELEPLAYYVHDRKRVLREALRTLKGKRLDAMIPPVLKVIKMIIM